MKPKSAFFFVAVAGLCLGVGLAQLAEPLAEYLAARALRARGFTEVSMRFSYPRTGTLAVDAAHARYKNMAVSCPRVVVENPFYFIWGGFAPSVFAENAALRIRDEGAPVIRESAETAFHKLADFARAFPFARAQIDMLTLEIQKADGDVDWRGAALVKTSPAFLTAETTLRTQAHTLKIGGELARAKASGYLWWRLDDDNAADKNAPTVWGGMAWDEGRLASFIHTDKNGKSVFAAGDGARAFEKLAELFSLLAAP